MIINDDIIKKYKFYLIEEEKADSTINKYLLDIKDFIKWNNNRYIDKQIIIEYKQHLIDSDLKPKTINAKISSINSFLKYLGEIQCCVKLLKLQNQVFRDEKKELSIQEYKTLVKTANHLKKYRLSLVLQTICSTGIRVSELKYITVEAVNKGKAEIHLKGKDRTILIPEALISKLLFYCNERNIRQGEIFLTKNNKSLDRKQIWQEMKKLCRKAGIEESKVYPHNLRHLFAVTFYKESNDIVKLSDILGHSSINTTRIYLLSTGKEHLNLLNKLQLVC